MTGSISSVCSRSSWQGEHVQPAIVIEMMVRVFNKVRGVIQKMKHLFLFGFAVDHGVRTACRGFQRGPRRTVPAAETAVSARVYV
jgi:hypothetical protein